MISNITHNQARSRRSVMAALGFGKNLSANGHSEGRNDAVQ
jgi:hypothetical protein